MLDLSKNLILFFIFSVFVVGTLPAISGQQLGDFTEGYIIEFPSDNSLRQSKDYDFTFHVYNVSDGVPITNTTTSCNFNLFNIDGRKILDQNPVYNNSNPIPEWNILVRAGNFSELGEIHYTIQCNSSLYGGFNNVKVDITADGEPKQIFPTQFFFIILAFFLIFTSYFNERLTLFRYMGSIFAMIMGVWTLWPGYSFINHSNLTGLGLGTILIGLGFYFLIEDNFSRDVQADRYDQYHKKREREDETFADDDLFDDFEEVDDEE